MTIARNKYGVNFDEGIPFNSEWEFNNLFVPFHLEQNKTLLEWLENGIKPILIGGQIGSGKTSFINKVLFDSKINADIVFHFDIEGNNLSEGDFIRILISEVLKLAYNIEIDLSSIEFPKDFVADEITDWKSLTKKLLNKELTIDYYNYKKKVSNLLFENSEYIFDLLAEIIRSIEAKLKRNIFFYASGIDKYNPNLYGFHALQSSLHFLANYKTLFEVNAVHLFDNKWQLKIYDKIFLDAFSKECIIEILNKRKGAYVKTSKYNINEKLAELSAGNPRQALRLLVHYDFYFNKSKSVSKSIHEAIRKTSQDLFAYADEPSNELINTIDRDKKISSTLLNQPGDKDTALRAVYGNWIVIKNSKEANVWNADINPIIKYFYKSEINTEDYEMLALRKIANNLEMNVTGTTFKVVDNDYLPEIHRQLSKAVTEDYSMNLVDSLDLLSDSLLSENRQDRVIIVYNDEKLMEAVKAYIFSRVYSYSNPSIINYSLNDQEAFVFQLEKILLKNKVDIYSFTFTNEFSDNEIIEADKLRDTMLDFQILWWIPKTHFQKYLQRWIQLRQLFQIVLLEDEILSSLSKEQIESDIEFYKEIKGEDSPMVNNLKTVLNYFL